MSLYELQPRFVSLFSGLETAFGTGQGRWVKRPPRPEDWANHLAGRGPGIGIAPLRPDSTVLFAVIDLDEPDFDAGREMQKHIPGASFVERSRSGNCHVWIFFAEPVAAWLPMAILKEATLAAGREAVEVFPKNHDFTRVRLGNYVNLPYHGAARPVLAKDGGAMPLGQFVAEAEGSLNDPADWQKAADWLLLSAPNNRRSGQEFGTNPNLHSCAEYVIHGEAGDITEGHRNAVFFMLAKCLTNWSEVDHDEALDFLLGVNEDLCSPPEDPHELRRILSNVERARYTSTGCSEALVLPFTDPHCKIAHPKEH